MVKGLKEFCEHSITKKAFVACCSLVLTILIFYWDRAQFNGAGSGIYSIVVDCIIAIAMGIATICIFKAIDKKGITQLEERIPSKLYKYLPVILFLLALLLRTVQFGLLPIAMMCDEQSMVYDAWSLAHYGIDRNGYHFPMYLEAWGSGQSALLAYITIPFVLLFGLNIYGARVGMLLVSLLAVWVFYLLVKKMKNKNVGLIALFLFAICPFHVMMSRWGLDCNLFINFMIFALYFLVLSFDEKKHWFFVLACFFFGLCMYTYALSYPILFIFLILSYIYLLCFKKIKWVSFIIGNCLLAVMCVPILLFLMVNQGWIAPITTSWFSVPKLSHYRGSEIAIGWGTIKRIIYFIFEFDRDLRAGTVLFGSMYHISTIFFLIGMVMTFVRTFQQLRAKEFNIMTFLSILFIACLVEALMVRISFYRWNVMFICSYFMTAIGLESVVKYAGKWFYALFTSYLVLTVLFMGYYATFYNYELNYSYEVGLDQAINYVEENNIDKHNVEVYSTWEGAMSTMMTLKMPTPVMLEGIQYDFEQIGWRKITRLYNYHYYSTCLDYNCETVVIEPSLDNWYIVKDGVCNHCKTTMNIDGVFDDNWEAVRFLDFIVYKPISIE